MGMFKGMNMKSAYESLSLGMAKQEVLKMFGEPNSQKTRDCIEIYTWWSSEFKGLLRGGMIERRATVEFQDGKVVGFDGENMGRSAW